MIPTLVTTFRPDLILYHGDCPDGFGSAFVAWKYLKDTAQYRACKHRDEPPDCTGLHVAVFDFSWSLDKVRRIKAQASSFVLLDHHASALKELGSEEGCYFDMKSSGAALAWKFFFPDTEPPRLIQFVEDQDLWNWKIPFSREFNIAREMIPFDFQAWDELLDNEKVDQLISKGTTILEYRQTCVDRICSKATKHVWLGYNVYVVNTSIFTSEIGNELAKREDCDFSVMWSKEVGKEEFSISLRSSGEIPVDVSVIAKRYGGGGHPCASGCVWRGPTMEELFESAEQFV